MSDVYFSDREFGARPRDVQEITPPVWRGIVGAINSRVGAGAFGSDFPRRCEDGGTLITGTDETTLSQAIQGIIPDLEWPLRTVTSTESDGMFPSYETEPFAPPTATALDLVEFCWRHVAQPDERNFHPHYSHSHLDFERETGRQTFANEINLIFARNGLAYELRDTGRVERLAPPVLRETLRSAVFQTGDDALDGLLETARSKFLSHDANVRRESIEKLWDAWERLKTIDEQRKPLGIQRLLDNVTCEARYRAALEAEARALTDIGNNFRIRHHETDRSPISDEAQVDYLFHRLFAFMLLILKNIPAAESE